MTYRLTPAADRDSTDILREAVRTFGPLQRARYAELIERAIAMIVEAPERVGSRPRDELAPGVRSFPVELAARRRGAASHVLFYLRGRLDKEGEGVIVVRVLHHRMEPAHRIGRGLS